MKEHNSLYDKLLDLKEKVEKKEVSIDSLSDVEVAALSLLCEVEMIKLNDEIAFNEAILNGYKIRFANAIEYLKKKSNFEL